MVEALSRHTTLAAVPVAVELAGEAPGNSRQPGIIGIAGDRARALALARALLAQAVVHHGPADLRVAVLAGDEAGGTGREHEWEWAKWLPHVRFDRIGGGERRLLAAGVDAADDLVTDLIREHPPGRPHDQPRARGTDDAVRHRR